MAKVKLQRRYLTPEGVLVVTPQSKGTVRIEMASSQSFPEYDEYGPEVNVDLSEDQVMDLHAALDGLIEAPTAEDSSSYQMESRKV